MPPSPRRCEIRSGKMRQRFSPWSALRVDPRGRDELRQPVADPADPLGGVDLPVVDPAQHGQVRQTSSRRRTPTARCGGTRTTTPAGRTRDVRSRGRGRRRRGAARPGSSGSPGRRPGAARRRPCTIGTTAASQHSIRSDSGESVPPKSRHAARARFSRSSSRTSTFTCGRCPPHSGTIDEGAWSSTYPHTSASASACRSPAEPVVVAGQRLAPSRRSRRRWRRTSPRRRTGP